MDVYSQAISVPLPEHIAHWVGTYPFSLWLDSAMPEHPKSRHSLVVLRPLARLTIDSSGAGILEQEGGPVPVPDPWSFLSASLVEHRLDSDRHPFFSGGWVGFLSYESYGSRLKQKPRRRVAGLPDAVFLAVDTGMVIDHAEQRAWIFSLGLNALGKAGGRAVAERKIRWFLNSMIPPPSSVGANLVFAREDGARGRTQGSPLRSNIPRQSYLEKIAEIHEAILRGDCYQVNLSQQFSLSGAFDPVELYLRLRVASPAPQMAFFNFEDFQIFSASPEVLLEIGEGRVSSYPIKGTRPRDPDAPRDLHLGEELLASPKDNAELLMIVDLVRNDLGQFCFPGSIHVPRLKALESFPRVHHLVATVEGKLEPGTDAFQALLKVSPGGSITGAPKLKAMEIIDALEPDPRGIYTGSIGFADFSGRASFNIAIRTAFLSGNRLTYSAGGGIVADSDPVKEYEETLHKAEGFFRALDM